MRFTMPSLTPVVMWLLIINTAIFVLTFMVHAIDVFFIRFFSVFPMTTGMSLQVWRWITYQFLHDSEGFGHIFWNMLGLFFFGPMLERMWGSKRFLIFYLTCGAMGGILYTILARTGVLLPLPLIGASGAFLGILAAVAILYPNIKVLVMFIFPVPLCILAPVLAIISFMSIIKGTNNAGGEAAHLAGLAAGAAYVMWKPWKQKFTQPSAKPTIKWQHKMNQERALQADVDRILDKVHKRGLASLTRQEKKVLQQASQQHQNNR